MVGILEVDRIDFGQRHELLDVDHVIVVRLEVLELLVGKSHRDSLLDLETAHQLAAVDDRVVDGAIDLLLNAALVLPMEEVKADRLRAGGSEKFDRYRYESKRNRTGGNRSCSHKRWLLGGLSGTHSKSKLCNRGCAIGVAHPFANSSPKFLARCSRAIILCAVTFALFPRLQFGFSSLRPMFELASMMQPYPQHEVEKDRNCSDRCGNANGARGVLW